MNRIFELSSSFVVLRDETLGGVVAQLCPSSLSHACTGFGANSNQGQIVTDIGYYLGMLVTILNDSLIILPIPN